MTSEKMRGAFEWHAQNPHVGGIKLSVELSPEPFDNGDYKDRHTQCAWEAWQAALASLPSMSEEELMELLCSAYEQGFDSVNGTWRYKHHAGRDAQTSALIAKLPHIVRGK